MNKIIILIALLIITPLVLYAEEKPAAEKTSSKTDYSTSLYLRYNITRPDYAKTPYLLGVDAGADMDLGGDIPVLKLSGIGFSSRYIFLNNKNEINDEISVSHYFSTGISFYIKTRLKKPVNFGLRAGTGSGWLINNEIDEFTENNKRLNGLYTEAGFYTEFSNSGNFYIESGVDIRKQHYFIRESHIDPVDMGFIYIKAGIKL